MTFIKNRKRCLGEADPEQDDDDEDRIECIGNCVYFYAEVTTKNCYKLLTKMHEAASNLPNTICKKKIYLFIHSGGGDAYAGLSAYTHISKFPHKVVTVADGLTASAATLLFLGSKHRRIMPHAQVLIHQLRTSFWGKYAELGDEYKNTTKLMASLKQIYKENTKLDSKQLDNYLKSEVCMGSDECVKYGLGKLFR